MHMFKSEQTGCINMIIIQGADVDFAIQDEGGGLLEDGVSFAGQVRDLEGNLQGEFIFEKDVENNMIYVSLPHNVTASLIPLPKYYSNTFIAENEELLNRYVYDIEYNISINNKTYKLMYGYIYVLQEVTTR